MAYSYAPCCDKPRFVQIVRTENGAYPKCSACGARLVATKVRRAKHSRSSHFEPFVSPVDGSVITTKRELNDHNQRNQVVNVHEGYDEATYFDMVNRDHFAPLEKERKKDLDKDIEQCVNMLSNGYVPTTAPESEIIPE